MPLIRHRQMSTERPKGNPRPNPKLRTPHVAPSIPRSKRGLNFTSISLPHFEEDMKRAKPGLITKPIPELHRIHVEYHKAALQATVSMAEDWEKTFFAETKITPTDLWELCRLQLSVGIPRLHNSKRLLLLLMIDTVAEHFPGESRYAIEVAVPMFLMGEWEIVSKLFPRVTPRIRQLARDSHAPDVFAVLGFINVREGRPAQALDNMQTAYRLAEVDGAPKFRTEPMCAAELARLLVKKGDTAAARTLLEGAIKFDTPDICYEAAKLIGDGEGNEERYRTLMGKAAMMGNVGAIKAMSALEHKAYERELAEGDEEGGGHMMEALEWQTLAKAWEVRGVDGLRYY